MWQKGQSGNPAGQSKRRLISTQIERELLTAAACGDKTKARAIAEKVIEMALNGNPWAVQFVTERTEGKPEQPISIAREVTELDDADLAAIAAGSRDRTAEEAPRAPESGAVH